ncbi:thiolase family protein [Dactylosporangium sp. NPDC000555]|uniref:thiolase family protein n=1 Tax=Dactylosporangium sp. NPDC000555 TaxID=3154260 RepID=UPI0033233284
MSVFLDGARIVGVHTTAVGRSLHPRTGFSLALESLLGALDDAGMTIGEVDCVYASTSGWPAGSPPFPEAFWAKQIGRPLRWGGSMFGIPAVLDAAAAITAGLIDTAAVVVGNCRVPDAGATAVWTRPEHEFTAWSGSFTSVQYGLAAQRYIHEYGDKALHAMGRASATIRNYGSIHPGAIYEGRGPFTAADVLASRPIASPLTLLMCSAVNDGGHALIMTRTDRAADTPKAPISVLAGANQRPYPSYFEAPVLDAVPNEGAFVTEAMRRAGITHQDIDVVQLYDHFAIGVLMEFEMYGFCKPGEAADFVESGVMELNGRYPTCTDGGLQSYSHNGKPSLYRVIEGVRQLRNEVPDRCPNWADGEHSHTDGVCRAVRDARTAFVTNPGPPTGGGAFAVLRRS